MTLPSGHASTAFFRAAFLLFSWAAAPIVSGSVIERIRSSVFWLIAILVGSVTWIIDALGMHWDGWMIKLLGYHDAYVSGVEGITYTATNICLTSTTLSAIAFNFLLSLAGGLLAGYMVWCPRETLSGHTRVD